LERDGQPLTELSGNRKALILLAILAADGTVGRDRLLTLLWPESDTERARGALRQTLHLIRHTMAMGDVVTGTAELRLNPLLIRSDVDDFMTAVRAHNAVAAVECHQGPFLDAVHTSNAPEFERWLDQRREELAQHYARALEQLAEAAETQEDYATAVTWWRKRQAIDPANGVIARRLMRALDAAGQRTAALRHAQVHETVMQREYELPPDPAVAALAEEVRAQQPPLHAETFARLAARIPGLRTRRHPVVALLATASIAVLVIAGGLVAAFTASRGAPPVIAAAPDKTRALEYLLKGEELLKKKDVEATRTAKVYYTQAIALDPDLVDAHLALAAAELAPALTDPQPRVARAKAATLRALAADSTSVAAHATMVWIKTIYDRDFPAAERHFRRAYQLDPDYPPLMNAYSAYLLTLGQSEASLRAMIRAYELRPDAAPNIGFLAVRYVMLNRPVEARRYIDQALALDSSFFMTRWVLGRLHLAAGDYDAALREFSHPGTDLGGIGQSALIGYTLARAGRTEEARAVIDGLMEKRKDGGFVAPSDVAIIYLGLGEHERALDWLEQLVDQRGQRIFLKAEPIFDPLRSHPRFQKLLGALNLPA
ncbi:MAG TPA: BTAD domain-containing putative transcriptional regulator, partial [Longimicrobiales bacterium]